MTQLVTIALRLLGLSKISPWVLMALPYIPKIVEFLDDAKATWGSFKTKYPWIASKIEQLASRLMPQLPAPEAAMIALRGIFAPRTLDEQQQDLWRKADGTEPVNKDLGDFPRNPMN